MKKLTEQVFTRLSKKQKRDMNRDAKRMEISPSAYVRAALTEYMVGRGAFLK